MEVTAYVEECSRKALDSPMPEPETAFEGVFAERFELLGDGLAPWSRWKTEPTQPAGPGPSSNSGALNGGGA